jgi:hypothetical protein
LKVGQYQVRKNGRPRILDHEKIKAGILAGKYDSVVAAEVGCDKTSVGRIRRKMGIFRGRYKYIYKFGEAKA